MKLQIKKDVVYVYHEKDEVLAILGADENSTMYRIGGWFGKKLFDLLEDKTTLGNLTLETQKTFLRLLVTLVQKDLLESLENNQCKNLEPLTQEEWEHLGIENFDRKGEQKKLTAFADPGAGCNTTTGINPYPSGSPVYYTWNTNFDLGGGHVHNSTGWYSESALGQWTNYDCLTHVAGT